MKEQPQNIRDKKLYKFASAKRYIKIHVPDFAFKHDDNNVGKDKFVGRELQIRRLFTWLTSDSKSGSYLITGYRGMGKSLLVKRVIDMITREPKAYKEFMFQIAVVLTFLACFIGIVVDSSIFPKEWKWISDYKWTITAILGSLAVFIIAFLGISKQINQVLFEYNVRKVSHHHIFDKNMIAKFWLKNKDRRNRKYSNIAITVNLGQEVLNERDVLSLIAHSIREKYYKFVHNRQSRPIMSYICIIFSMILSFFAVKHFIMPLLTYLCPDILVCFFEDNPIIYLVVLVIVYLFFYYWTVKLLKTLRKKTPYFSTPYNSLDRLDALCERVASSLNEEKGSHTQYSSNNSFLNITLGKERKSIKSTPIATVRELEQELMGIVNNINGEDCPYGYCAQFIIVFDELDKIANVRKKSDLEMVENDEETSPAFETSVRGFTDAIAYEERKQKVLRLLANMKLFITSVKAKCVFISGHELFDASLADLSDREFAISSIFNGVLNVSSFLSPEREESDVSSMTEVYLATMLLPESYLKRRFERDVPKSSLSQIKDYVTKRFNERITRIIFFWPRIWPKSYLKQKVGENILKNGILKDELPSLRWYNEYLMDIHILNNETILNDEELKERELEIRHVMEFLRCFCVYLSQISNGSPKKIATYFEKYVKVNFDTIKQFDWYDEIEVGQPTEDDVRKQCVLYFDSDAQRLINFIHYIAAPVMNAITNEVSHYGDKLLVSSSFMLDQIYKYHGKGFSWRNLEQMPELLNTNKTPELRDSMASIMEFLLQTHIATISSGVFQYKFHKQIAEEISMLSKTSEEAAAIFNFTLNESETVKRYNTRLLWTYLNLTKQTNDESQKARYCGILERLHENQGDIYFSEEDYYRAIHEYRSALQYIVEKNISPENLIAYLKCSLKVGLSYEYRHTFENAYMVYCQIINNLVQLRWMDEKEFGLDYTMRLTHDWRVKQTVLVNAKSLSGWFSCNDNKRIRKQFKPGLLEDIREDNKAFKPVFSIDADKTISSLAKTFTPEKSNLFLCLTAFEDVKFIYQAIIAKLFVIEKMESSGITQSSIDAAEAEFMTLYGITNHNEKYILAADFFSKLAGILYYKNTIVSSELPDNIFTSLYLFDIDLLALIDDYCFKVCRDPNSDDAIQIKDDVRLFLSSIQTDELNVLWNVDSKNNKDMYYTALLGRGQISDEVKLLLSTIQTTELIFIRDSGPKRIEDLYYAALLSSGVCKKLFDSCKDKNKFGGALKNTLDYFKYLDIHEYGNIEGKWGSLIACYNRRNRLSKEGCKLPCTACKYANRSMTILMQQLFGYNETVDSRAFTLLSNTSHAKLKVLRPEILSQLASSSEQLADIMMSCAFTTPEKRDDGNIEVLDPKPDNISTETIDLLAILTMNDLKEIEREKAIMAFKTKNQSREHIGKLNRAIIYYWAACRYYDIASMHHEAVHCIWRITRVIENYLSVLFDIKARYKDNNLPEFFTDKNIDRLTQLLEQLFVWATRIVGRQHNNFDSVEIHELKWLSHLELVDDIDLTKLTLFPDLQSIFLSIINNKILVAQIKSDYKLKRWRLKTDKGNNYDGKKGKTAEATEKEHEKYDIGSKMSLRDYLSMMYLRFTGQRHERTFKSDVELNYFKAKLNYTIFCDLLGGYDVKKQFLYKKENISEYYREFYGNLRLLIDDIRPRSSKRMSENFYVKELFKSKDNTVQTKLDLLDFLIYDSLVCLCNIINALPPHNQFSTFSNSFIANVYEDIWAWSKYYEVMYNMYLYYGYYLAGNEKRMNDMTRYYPDRCDMKTKKFVMNSYAKILKNNKVVCKDDYGYRYSKLFMNIRHDMDDATIHHIFCNYSAEMAIKYYRAVRGVNTEGQEYKNMINNMYVLDDDLRNDTCQSNLADERYLQNSGIIEKKLKAMQRLYVNSRANRLSSYESNIDPIIDYQQLQERYDDSLYTNTEY